MGGLVVNCIVDASIDIVVLRFVVFKIAFLIPFARIFRRRQSRQLARYRNLTIYLNFFGRIKLKLKMGWKEIRLSKGNFLCLNIILVTFSPLSLKNDPAADLAASP